MIRTLYRTIDRKRQVIHGHLNKYEVAALRKEGWREDKPQVNRHGIPIGRAV
ncbi:hypothetical protein [Sporosarcina koreensis]|uniref:hypothetical protein n=1 Tax=Bacillales TaxID=1385 RepID=UPI000AB8EDA9|nr:hypothetical protein [Sporosarcina koreensis]